MSKEIKPLALCANGCGVPPAAPSKVICKKCQQKITHKLQEMLKEMENREMKKARGE